MRGRTKKLKLVFCTDPGHGWLRVPKDKMKLLPRSELEKISSHSYRTHTGSNFYLEEDQDAGVFLSWAKSAGYEVELLHADKGTRGSHIRELPRFSKEFITG